MQDEALHECRLLLFEDPALEAEPRCGTQGLFLLRGHFGRCVKARVNMLGFWGLIGLWAYEPFTLPTAKASLHVGEDASPSEAAARLTAGIAAHTCFEV